MYTTLNSCTQFSCFCLPIWDYRCILTWEWDLNFLLFMKPFLGVYRVLKDPFLSCETCSIPTLVFNMHYECFVCNIFLICHCVFICRCVGMFMCKQLCREARRGFPDPGELELQAVINIPMRTEIRYSGRESLSVLNHWAITLDPKELIKDTFCLFLGISLK